MLSQEEKRKIEDEMYLTDSESVRRLRLLLDSETPTQFMNRLNYYVDRRVILWNPQPRKRTDAQT